MFISRILVLAAIAGQSVIAQDLSNSDLLEIIGKTPSCAQICTLNVLAEANCQLKDIRSCLCYSSQRQRLLATCVLANCSQADQAKSSEALQSGVCTGIEQETRWPEVRNMFIISAVLMYVVVTLRFASRIWIAKRVWWDDWCILATALLWIPPIVLANMHPNEGFGRHFWDIKPQYVQTLRKNFYTQQPLYVCGLTLSKFSLLFLYLRIFPSKSFRRFVIYCMVFMMMNFVAFIGALLFQCIPVQAVWTLEPAKCINITQLGVAGAGITIFEDFFIMFIPALELRRLQLSLRKRLALLFMFALGSFATITSIIRLQYIVKFSNSIDVTWDQVDVIIWSNIEVSTAVIFASLVSIRPLFIKLIPDRLRSTNKGSGYSSGSVPKPPKSPISPKRWTTVFDFKLKDPKSQGHLQLADEGVGRDPSPARSITPSRAQSPANLNKELPQIRVTHESGYPSRSVELDDLRREPHTWAPGASTQTSIQGGKY